MNGCQESLMFDVAPIVNPIILTEKNEIPVGLCQCGCGGETRLPLKDDKASGAVMGKPNRYIHGHSIGRKLSANTNWKGGRTASNGYVMVKLHGHPHADKNGYVMEHTLMAEKAIGRKLKGGERCHHVDGEGKNNRPGNLVICPDQEYHMLLHLRTRALKACGHANFRKCQACKAYDDPENMKRQARGNYAHQSCMAGYQRQLKAKRDATCG